MHVVVAERAVLDRVRGIAGLLQGAVAERVGVDDDGAALGQVADVRPQRGRVHHDEHVRAVAGREDVVIREVHLEAGDAGQRAGRRADLGGEVGERREVVAEHRRLAREAVAGELHPVTGVTREADDHAFELLDLLRAHPVTIAPVSDSVGHLLAGRRTSRMPQASPEAKSSSASTSSAQPRKWRFGVVRGAALDGDARLARRSASPSASSSRRRRPPRPQVPRRSPWASRLQSTARVRRAGTR